MMAVRRVKRRVTKEDQYYNFWRLNSSYLEVHLVSDTGRMTFDTSEKVYLHFKEDTYDLAVGGSRSFTLLYMFKYSAVLTKANTLYLNPI
jgi:hypothetical protein